MRENRRPSIERHRDYCWRKVEEFQWNDFRLVTSSSFTFIRGMASLRKSDVLTLKNRKERLPRLPEEMTL